MAVVAATGGTRAPPAVRKEASERPLGGKGVTEGGRGYGGGILKEDRWSRW